jgi:hypothetical protein
MYKLNKRNVKRDQKAREYIDKTKKAILEAGDSMGLPEKTSKDHKNELIMQIFKEEEEDEEASAEFNRPRP